MLDAYFYLDRIASGAGFAGAAVGCLLATLESLQVVYISILFSPNLGVAAVAVKVMRDTGAVGCFFRQPSVLQFRERVDGTMTRERTEEVRRREECPARVAWTLPRCVGFNGMIDCFKENFARRPAPGVQRVAVSSGCMSVEVVLLRVFLFCFPFLFVLFRFTTDRRNEE